ncbi:MAG: L-seryl-tRNA(Sec) selenium transferase [Gemmatimonadota bacterium]
MTDTRRTLPAVGALLSLPAISELMTREPRSLVVEAVRRAINSVRSGLPAPDSDQAWTELVRQEVVALGTPSLRPVINGTGVVLHTNLGRAPLAQSAIAAMTEVASGFSNLEYDLTRGGRGSRHDHCVELLRELTGAGDALVVNNCAAALVLALNTFADAREAIVSRGELIEIGGSFRVPDIMARSGARLREVGTTNRTHPDDYRKALSADCGTVVKIHRSNFELIGFTAEASLRDLAPIAGEAGVPLIFDFGSGLLIPLDEFGLRGEPVAADAVRDGATLTVMSGDKLLGGPQAGIIAGTPEAVAACRRNPLTRALRVDKLTLAALEATLRLYRDPVEARREIPVLRMLGTSIETLATRAEAISAVLPAGSLAVVDTTATVGGGAFPSARIPSLGLAPAGDAMALDQALRGAAFPVVGRIDGNRLVIDLRSTPPEFDDRLTRSLATALGGGRLPA